MTEPQKIKITGTGLIYKNPKPYLRAVHAMHPCLSVDADGHIIATFDLGQGPESLDYHTVLARSGGRFTDAMEREMFERQFGSNWWPR